MLHDNTEYSTICRKILKKTLYIVQEGEILLIIYNKSTGDDGIDK